MKYRLIFLGITGLFFIITTQALSAGSARAAFTGNPGIEMGAVVQDNRVTMREHYHATTTNDNMNNTGPDMKSEELFNKHIHIWILIVLLVFGTYILIVGFITYSFIRRIGS